MTEYLTDCIETDEVADQVYDDTASEIWRKIRIQVGRLHSPMDAVLDAPLYAEELLVESFKQLEKDLDKAGNYISKLFTKMMNQFRKDQEEK